MNVTRRLDGFQQRHRWAGYPIAVVYKFGEDQGPYLAALITYYGFLGVPALLRLDSYSDSVEGEPDCSRSSIELSQIPVSRRSRGVCSGVV